MKIYSDSLHKIDGYPELSKDNAEQQKNRFFVDGNPAALLITEQRADTVHELEDWARKIVYNNTTMMGKLIGEDNPLVGIEPSAILTFRDEYPDLVPADKRKETQRFVDHCLLYDDLLSVRLWPDQRVSPCSWQHMGHHAGSRYWTERESGQSTR